MTDERRESFVSLLCDAAKEGKLTRATFSRPNQSGDGFVRASATLYQSGGGLFVRIDTALSDGKVIRKNYAPADAGPVFDELSKRCRQCNLTACGANAQYMVSKKGKETIVGEHSVREAMRVGGPAPTTAIGNDEEKRYFWHGDEDWLIALGISDAGGRVHDKRQSKFR